MVPGCPAGSAACERRVLLCDVFMTARSSCSHALHLLWRRDVCGPCPLWHRGGQLWLSMFLPSSLSGSSHGEHRTGGVFHTEPRSQTTAASHTTSVLWKPTLVFPVLGWGCMRLHLTPQAGQVHLSELTFTVFCKQCTPVCVCVVRI